MRQLTKVATVVAKVATVVAKVATVVAKVATVVAKVATVVELQLNCTCDLVSTGPQLDLNSSSPSSELL